MSTCGMCGDEFSEQEVTARSIVSSGGWCCPADQVYPIGVEAEPEVLCSDCRSRMVFAMEVGFDPGRHGENLKMSRQALRSEWKAEQ